MSYLNDFLTGEKINKAISIAEKRLEGIDFTAIAVRGNSGLLIGSPLAAYLTKNLIIVRKRTEKSHSYNPVEGFRIAPQKILLVDDFIETGNTLKHMYRKIMSHCNEPEIVGVYLYNSSAQSEYEDKVFDINKKTEIPVYRPRRRDRK